MAVTGRHSLARVCALRTAFSSIPDVPARRASSSSTCSGRQPVVGQHDQAMEPEVGGLGDDPFGRTVLGRHHRFGRFFADLLQDRVLAARKQARHIRRVGIAAAARLDDGGQLASGWRRSFAVDELGVLQHRIDRLPAAVVETPEEAALRARCGTRCHRPARQRTARRRRRSRVGSRARAACARTPRPCATAGRASATSRPRCAVAAVSASASRFAQATISTRARGAVLRDDRHQPVGVEGTSSSQRCAVSAELTHPVASARRARPCNPWPPARCTRRKWKIDAASTASAPPTVTPSARCSSVPTPPEAITGTGTASATARVSSRSKPWRVPSRSMLVSRISPAPSA